MPTGAPPYTCVWAHTHRDTHTPESKGRAWGGHTGTAPLGNGMTPQACTGGYPLPCLLPAWSLRAQPGPSGRTAGGLKVLPKGCNLSGEMELSCDSSEEGGDVACSGLQIHQLVGMVPLQEPRRPARGQRLGGTPGTARLGAAGQGCTVWEGAAHRPQGLRRLPPPQAPQS